jgi:hypothetical protein
MLRLFHVSDEPREPIAALVNHDVELRVVMHLHELREEVLQSTVDFSILRMRNAPARSGGSHLW